MEKTGFPPQPESGTFWLICHNCSKTREEYGFSNKFDSEKPKCDECKKEMSVIRFLPLDPDADIDAT